MKCEVEGRITVALEMMRVDPALIITPRVLAKLSCIQYIYTFAQYD